MTELDSKKGHKKIYEIGYILISSIPLEKINTAVYGLKDILQKNEAEIIAEEIPESRALAYTIVKKIGTENHKFDEGYFGWLKFELDVNKIEIVKKAFEQYPEMLRMLLITTVRENTYLGRKDQSIALKAEEIILDESQMTLPIPSSVEEMDKSIDELVKEE